MQGYLDVLDRCLDEDQLLLVKLHPFVGNGLNLSGYQHIQKFPEGYDTYEVLNMCDVLITDYSSVMYDFANSGKKRLSCLLMILRIMQEAGACTRTSGPILFLWCARQKRWQTC